MIAYDLICSKGHRFECWFKDSASYERQNASGVINCPVCNENSVVRIFSSFAIKKNGEKKKNPPKKGQVDPQQVLQLIQEYVERHFEDVGLDFTKEALKIHYGDSKKRNIKGTATPDQESLLKQEGVQFIKIPIIKRIDN
jgi:hypothetical protein